MVAPKSPSAFNFSTDVRSSNAVTSDPTFAFPDQREPVVGAPRQVAIEQVDRRVANTADEVLEMREMPFSHGVPGPHPVEFPRNLGPELVGALSRSREQGLPRADAPAVGRTRAPGVRQVQPARADEIRGAGIADHERDSTGIIL